MVQGGRGARFIGSLPADGIELTCAKTSTLGRTHGCGGRESRERGILASILTMTRPVYRSTYSSVNDGISLTARYTRATKSPRNLGEHQPPVAATAMPPVVRQDYEHACAQAACPKPVRLASNTTLRMPFWPELLVLGGLLINKMLDTYTDRQVPGVRKQTTNRSIRTCREGK